MDATLQDRLLISIPDACKSLGCGRSKMYQLIGDGQVQTVKLGRNTRIVAQSMRQFVAELVEANDLKQRGEIRRAPIK